MGKVRPKGETGRTEEGKLIRASVREKAREGRDTSLKVPNGEGGKVIDVKTFSRARGDDLSPGVNELVRVFVATKRKISEGDKLAGRHGNKGVVSQSGAGGDPPYLAGGRRARAVPGGGHSPGRRRGLGAGKRGLGLRVRGAAGLRGGGSGSDLWQGRVVEPRHGRNPLSLCIGEGAAR